MLKAMTRKRDFHLQNNERGSILLVVLLMLVLLTVLGFYLSSSSSVEVRIAGNERVPDIAFYSAESGWQVALAWLNSKAVGIIDSHGSDSGGGELFTTAKAGAADTLAGGYQVDIAFNGAIHATGYSTDYKRYLYNIDSLGTGPGNAQAEVQIRAGKIYKVGGY